MLLNIIDGHLAERVEDYERWLEGPITAADRRREAAIQKTFAGRIRS